MTTRRCGHWIGTAGRYCHAIDNLRPYLQGLCCPAHTPAALARQPEPPSTPNHAPASPEGSHLVSTADLLAAALAHAERGWHVFPLRFDDKRPAFPDHTASDCTGRDPRCRAAGRHLGWEARATVDPDRIRRAWSTRPYSIGLACGPSRLVVVDLDVPKGDTPDDTCTGLDVLTELTAAHSGGIEATYTVTTGRGGIHLYYRHPEDGPALRNTAGTIGPMVDTRAHGGYVVAAGSTVNGRPYTVELDTDPAPLPGWLAALLAPAPLPLQRPVVVELPTDRTGAYVRAAIQRETERVTAAAKGERNRSLYIAAVALGQLVAGDALAEVDASAVLEQAAASAGLGRVETARTIRSGLAAGAHRPRKVAA